MNRTLFAFLLTGVVLLFVLAGAFFQVPQTIVMPLAILALPAGLWLFLRSQRRALLQPAAAVDPALQARVEACCQAAGHPGVPVTVVAGGGQPVLLVRDGRVTISPAMGELLNDEELTAMLQQGLTRPVQIGWADWLEYLWPLPVAAVLLAIPTVMTGRPFILLVLLLAIVWMTVASQFMTLGRRSLRRSFQEFLGRGGDPLALLSANLKLTRAIYWSTLNQYRGAYISQARRSLSDMARIAGVPSDQFEALAQAAGAPAELYRTVSRPIGERVAPWKPLLKIGVWVLLLGLSVLVATMLNGGR